MCPVRFAASVSTSSPHSASVIGLNSKRIAGDSELASRWAAPRKTAGFAAFRVDLDKTWPTPDECTERIERNCVRPRQPMVRTSIWARCDLRLKGVSVGPAQLNKARRVEHRCGDRFDPRG